ncbi:MAG: group II intron reverse transcriptase/maturase [Ruminiclostridium sp.]
MSVLTSERALKRKKLRHAEYYDMTEITDKLYTDSKANKAFNSLMPYIANRQNILLAYRNIKRNDGSTTPGVDGLTIKDIEKWPENRLVNTVQSKLAWYKPKPVRRKEIPKPNGKTRPLGIPTFIDRLVQQCILQIMEPICEAKFHERSNGFRPNRSAENALAQCYKMIQQQKLYYAVSVDIEGFFDNVDHCKLKKQLWNIGIRDKKLLCIISEMLKAPIVMPDNSRIYPLKGTPQGGILSPLLANVVLNEMDWWIASQWEFTKTRHAFYVGENSNGTPNLQNKRRQLKITTQLKEMFIVRYADDFLIFCRKKGEADNTAIALEKWLKERLNLNVSKEKTKVINLTKRKMEFLGFEIGTAPKRNTRIVNSHMSLKAKTRTTNNLREQIDKIQHPKDNVDRFMYISKYNSMVIGIHNYFRYATGVAADCMNIAWKMDKFFKNRLNRKRGGITLSRNGIATGYIKEQYGKSKALRFCNGTPIVPILFVKHKSPMYKKACICSYTPAGRKEMHKPLGIDMSILHRLMRSSVVYSSVEYVDNRISLYAAQYGRCAITGEQLAFEDIHCHHIIPVKLGGNDRYQNLIIIHKEIHKLIHATQKDTIDKYLSEFQLSKTMLKKLNKLREKAQLAPIE